MLKETIAQSTIGYMGWEQNLCLLSELNYEMFTPAPDTSAKLAVALLIHYSFDLSGYSALELVNIWEKQYPVSWIRIAVIEALYQGRYKAISVQQILSLWGRRGQATYHFNMEFERLICSKFPENLTSLPTPVSPVAKISSPPPENSTPRNDSSALNKPPEEFTLDNYRSIKQFTPEKSDDSESFTSKLKAIAQEN